MFDNSHVEREFIQGIEGEENTILQIVPHSIYNLA